jgi:type IV secretion system protein VirB5
MNIIKALVICIIASWMLIKASGAHAQIPVTDGASIATDVMNHIESIAKYVEQISQMKAQLDQMKQQYDALTGSRNLGAILNDPRYREYLPNDWQTVYSGLSDTAQTIYDATRKFDGCAHIPADDERSACQARAVKSAQDKAFATEAYERAQQRLSQIEQLMNRINGTEDPKAIAELQGRIASEQAMIQNEAAKLQMFQIIAQAEDAIQKRQAHELQMRDAARRATLGVAPMHFFLGRE